MQTVPKTQMGSEIDWLLSQPEPVRDRIIQSLPPSEYRALEDELYRWERFARPDQREPPGDWFLWIMQCGRGWGKTRTAAETVRARIDAGLCKTVNVAAPTWLDVMDTMVMGSAEAPGLMGVWPAHRKPSLRLSKDDP
ncbi:unnamed protein product, partial [marine sediment metagenome]